MTAEGWTMAYHSLAQVTSSIHSHVEALVGLAR